MAFVPRPSEGDLDFLATVVGGRGADRARVRRRLHQDPGFLAEALDRPQALSCLDGDAQASVTISPWLLFALLLRAAERDLGPLGAIPEWTGRHLVVPVLDGAVARSALAQPGVRAELERVLTAFTHTSAWRMTVYENGRVRQLQVSDLEPESLEQVLPYAHGEVAGDLLRRMADAYLFLAGVYPDHVVEGRGQDLLAWERRGQGLYRTAAAHYEEEAPDWARNLEDLAASFHPARRALNFVMERYMTKTHRSWFEPLGRGA